LSLGRLNEVVDILAFDRRSGFRYDKCIQLNCGPLNLIFGGAGWGAIQSDAAMLSIRESREAWHMAAAKLSDEAFSAILEAHPGLRERFASIAMAVANSGENLKEADAIEERIVEEMRLLGREAMQGWAETQVKATEKEIRQQPSMHRQGKKNSAGIRNLAKSRF
jgi:hypothetical protein